MLLCSSSKKEGVNGVRPTNHAAMYALAGKKEPVWKDGRSIFVSTIAVAELLVGRMPLSILPNP